MMPYPVEPDPSCFTRPADLTPGYGTTVTDDGHVYGYLALFNARLIGSGKRNTKPPRSRSKYAYANAYQTKCSDGSVVRTGVLAGDGGHHFASGFKPTQEAYANVKHQIARVVYGEDQHGVWFSGALNPDVTDEQAALVRGSGVSGHWERPAPGKPQELLGSVLVNIPGFAQAADHRIVAAASLTPTGGVTIGYALDAPDANAEEDGAQGNVLRRADLSRVMGAGNCIVAAASRLVPISGVLAALGTPTSDGRQVNNVTWGELPLPLWTLNEQGEWGHCGAKLIGRINSITLDGALVRFTGEVEEGLPGAEDAQLIADLKVLGISMDGMPSDDSAVVYEYDDDGWPTMVIFEDYAIHGATLTSEPAFRETLGVTIGGDGVLEPAADDEENPAPDGEVPSEVGEQEPDEEQPIAAAASSGYTTISLPIIWQ